MWTAARLVTTVSPDNSRRWEPARTCGKAPGKAALPAAAGCPPLPPGRGGDEPVAAARSAIPASAERRRVHVGEVITLPVSLNESPPVTSESRKNGRGRDNNRDSTKRSFCRWKLVLRPRNLWVINGGGYCCVRVYSWTLTPGQLGWGWGGGRGRRRDNSHNL